MYENAAGGLLTGPEEMDLAAKGEYARRYLIICAGGGCRVSMMR